MNHVILLVDDEPAALRGLLRTLHTASLDFVTVDSAAQAIDRLEKQRIDVVVSDERMPGMSGHELLEIVARRWPATVRIMLTGETDADVVRRAVNRGHVHQFLNKPCDSATLLSAMRAALQRIDLERAARELLMANTRLRFTRGEPTHKSPGQVDNERESDGSWRVEPPAGDLEALVRSLRAAACETSAPPAPPELELATQGWRSIVDGIDDIVCLVDRKGAIERINRAIETWDVGDIRSALGRDAHSVFHGDCSATNCDLGCWIQRVVLSGSGDPIEIFDRVLERRLRLRAAPAAAGAGAPPRWLIVLRDVTAEYQLREETVRLHAQLAQAQKLEAIGRLAAGVAHEINTPAQFVRDNLEFLQSGVEPLTRAAKLHRDLLDAVNRSAADAELVAAQVKALAELDLNFILSEVGKAASEGIEGIARIASIVRALKEFSHPGGGTIGKIDLPRAIESTVTVARNEWKYVARVDTEFEPGLPSIDGYAGELNQVFLNLLVNAAQAIGEKAKDANAPSGHIRIRARRVHEDVEIRFEDDGPGIPESVRRHLFEPFFTTKPMGKGTGQGLALARSVIVGKHKGSIDLESEVGQGTTFILRLPISQAPNPAPDEAPMPSNDGQLARA